MYLREHVKKKLTILASFFLKKKLLECSETKEYAKIICDIFERPLIAR